jgi:site-specific DNA recombinase
MTTFAVAKRLTAEGIPTPAGKQNWSSSTVESILHNEKYRGSALLQKRFTVDFLQKKLKVNEGEVPQYYVENSHPAIVTPELFDQVQEEMKRRKQLGRRYRTGSLFSCRLVCGDCGEYFGPKVWNSTDKYRRVIWQCNAKFKGEHRCATPHLTEEIIKEKFIEAFNRLIPDRERLIADCRVMQAALCDCTEVDAAIEEALQETEVLAEMVQRGVEENSRVAQDQGEYNKRYAGLLQRYEAASAQLDTLQEKRAERQKKAEAIGRFMQRLAERDGALSEFTAGLWIDSIETVIVQCDGMLVFRFQNKVVTMD